MHDTLAVVLGGGQGSRLFPLTATRSKPAVPIGGKYRLIDVPVSRCLHAEIRRIFVLTQFNSASLNRHIGHTYQLDRFSGGFVEILAAEQTPDSPHWYQGTADAVRQSMRHITQHDADYYLILAGDHLYRMDYSELIQAHKHAGADVTIAAQPVDPGAATQMGIFRFDPAGQIVAFEEKPSLERLGQIGRSIPAGATFASHSDDQPFMASMGVYVFSRAVMLDLLEQEAGHDFGRELIPAALGRYRVRPYLYRGYWADVGTIESFYDANVMLGRPAAASGTRRIPSTRTCGTCPARASPTARSATPSSWTAASSIGRRSTTRSSGCAATSGRAAGSAGRSCSAPTSMRTATLPPGFRSSGSDARPCSTASSWTRTRGSATAYGWSTSGASSTPTATATSSAAGSSSSRRAASSRPGPLSEPRLTLSPRRAERPGNLRPQRAQRLFRPGEQVLRIS